MSAQNSPPIWLISFTDVIALMLTFFVLMYAMSDPDQTKWERKIGMTNNAVAEFSGPANNAGQNEGRNINRLEYEPGENMDYLQAVLEEIWADYTQSEFIKLERRGNEIVLLVSSFGENSDGDFPLFIRRLSEFLNTISNQIFLTTNFQDERPFQAMQSFGKILRESGYTRPFALSVRSRALGDGVECAIYIQPHTGRRIQ